ncbi:hypothetical protein ACXZ9C_11215 [Streptococcus agalactiae]
MAASRGRVRVASRAWRRRGVAWRASRRVAGVASRRGVAAQRGSSRRVGVRVASRARQHRVRRGVASRGRSRRVASVVTRGVGVVAGVVVASSSRGVAWRRVASR